MQAYSIGLSSMAVSQRLIELAGQNIANANTPGYHRQQALLASRTTGLELGTGVEINRVRRFIDQVVETAILGNSASLNSTTTQLDGLQQLENQITIGDGSLPDLLEKLFNQASRLAANPGDPTERRVFLFAAATLADQINNQTGALASLRQQLDLQAKQLVDQVNNLARQIADANAQVQRVAAGQGQEANDLRDRRDQLISQLSELVNVLTVNQPFGVVNVFAAGVPLVLGTDTLALQFGKDANNRAIVTSAGSAKPLNVDKGRLGGMLAVRNQSVDVALGRIEALAQDLVRNLDELHATGLSLEGPMSVLRGHRAVTNPNLPLSLANLTYPPEAGSLFVSITDKATGQRTLHEVTYDPATDSLQDVAAAINAINHLSAVVDSQSGTLVVLAQSGYGFDFAGRLSTAPDTQAITGSAVPQVGGAYTGSVNDTYTYSVVGSGTVGVSGNLTLEARNGAGLLLASWNIGQGYEAGTELTALNGVKLRLGAGTLNNGDNFTVKVVGDPDTGGLLPALGLNTLFTGSSAQDVQVRSDLLNNPALLAAGLTQQVGDGDNALRWAALRDAPRLDAQTYNAYYATVAGDVGNQVQDLSLRQSTQDMMRQRLEDERQSVSGVDPNEELVRMIQFQRAFQTAARYLQTINETLDDLLNLV